jgi:hypothetical protein
MSSSYYKSCNKCGRSIQLRQMPAGQWVAFEGYDKQHKCKKSPAAKSTPVKHTPANRKSAYDDIDFFSTFNVNGLSPISESTKENIWPSEPSQPNRPRTKKKSSPNNWKTNGTQHKSCVSPPIGASELTAKNPSPSNTGASVHSTGSQASSRAGIWLLIVIVLAGLAYCNK